MTSSLIAEFLTPGSGDWEPVDGGESGASVFLDRAHQRYAKLVSSAHVAELAAERDRSLWLNRTAIPSAPVVDWRESDAGAYLVSQAVTGVPAGQLDARALREVWPSIVDTVRMLHSLDPARCPFDRGLAQMLPLAKASVAEDRVVVAFLPVTLQGTPPRQILEQIETELPARLAEERAESVVCHGDLCLPNILVDADTAQVTALIDLGRLGRADPYGDIALLLATARETWSDEAMALRAEEQFAEIYGTTLDPHRRDFYLRLDPLTW